MTLAIGDKSLQYATSEFLSTQFFQVIIDFFNRILGWKWRIRDVVESNMLSDHHGYGDRQEDLKGCVSYCGVVMKTYVLTC